MAVVVEFVDRPSTIVETPILNPGPIRDLTLVQGEKLDEYLKTAAIGTNVKIPGSFSSEKAQWANFGNADGHIIVPFTIGKVTSGDHTASEQPDIHLFVWAKKTTGNPVADFKDVLPSGANLTATIRWNQSVQDAGMNEAYKNYVAAIGQIGKVSFFDGAILELASPDGETTVYYGETPILIIIFAVITIISLASLLYLCYQPFGDSTNEKKWKKYNTGASIIEYVLLAAFLSLIALTSIRTVGKTTTCQFAQAAVQIGDRNGYLNQDLINQFPDCCNGKVMVCNGVPAPPYFCQCLTGPPPPPPPVGL